MTERALSNARVGPRMVTLDDLVAHPLNSNVMSEDLQAKLRAHIKRTGRYPFLVVRPHPEQPSRFQGEILGEYRTTRYPGHFFNLKLGRAWADLDRRLDMASSLALCTDRPMLESAKGDCTMGVDTGKLLHVVILQNDTKNENAHHVVHLGTYRELSDLDALMERYSIHRCVIDGLPETHATRQFADRHVGNVYLCFFNDNQRGVPKFDWMNRKVEVNRTEALDASRAAIREKLTTLPRRDSQVELFARHMTADAKKLEEDEETGARKYRYFKNGENHYGFAFTYAWMAAVSCPSGRWLVSWNLD